MVGEKECSVSRVELSRLCQGKQMRAEASFELTGKANKDCRIRVTEGKEPIRCGTERFYRQ